MKDGPINFWRFVSLIFILGFSWIFLFVGKFFLPPAYGLYYPLHTAIQYNIEPLAYFLIDLHVFNKQKTRNIKGDCGSNPLEFAVKKDRYAIVKFLLLHSAPLEGCRHALAFAKPEMISFLIDNGVSPNDKWGYRRHPVLNFFLRCGKDKMHVNEGLKLLLDSGADPNALWKIKTTYDPSPLYLAASNNCVGNVKLLLERGADPFHVTYIKTRRTILDHIRDKDIYPWSSDRYVFSSELIEELQEGESKYASRKKY